MAQWVLQEHPFPGRDPGSPLCWPEKPAKKPGGGWGRGRVGTARRGPVSAAPTPGPRGPRWGSLTALAPTHTHTALLQALPSLLGQCWLQGVGLQTPTALGAHPPATVLRPHLQPLWLLLALQSPAGALAGLRPPAAHYLPREGPPGVPRGTSCAILGRCPLGGVHVYEACVHLRGGPEWGP